jgi:hypothetical protein
VDYLAGRKSGIYSPVILLTYQSENDETNNKKKIDYMNIMSEEVFRQYIRQKMGTAPNNSICFRNILGNSDAT